MQQRQPRLILSAATTAVFRYHGTCITAPERQTHRNFDVWMERWTAYRPPRSCIVMLHFGPTNTALTHRQTRADSCGTVIFLRYQDGAEPAGEPAYLSLMLRLCSRHIVPATLSRLHSFGRFRAVSAAEVSYVPMGGESRACAVCCKVIAPRALG